MPATFIFSVKTLSRADNAVKWKITATGTTGGKLYSETGGLLGNLGQEITATMNGIRINMPSVIRYGFTYATSVALLKDITGQDAAGFLDMTYKYANYSNFQNGSFKDMWVENQEYTVQNNIIVDVPAPPSVNISLENNSTFQQIKYKVGTGTETTLNPGRTVGLNNVESGVVLGINPVLTPRPIHFTSNGRVQKITYNAIDYNVFPTDINVDVSGTPTLDITGNPAPEITVNYTNTSEPVITDT